MYSITEFKTKVFVLSVKVLLQYRNKWVNTSSFMDRRFVLTIRTFWKRDFLSSIDLQSKPMDWFLHDLDLRYDRVKGDYYSIKNPRDQRNNGRFK